MKYPIYKDSETGLLYRSPGGFVQLSQNKATGEQYNSQIFAAFKPYIKEK